MKKWFTLLITIGYSLVCVAGNLDSTWVVTNEGKYIVNNLSIGETNAKGVLEDGKKITIPLDQITSYSLDGKLFKKLPLYINGKLTNQMVFMELVKVQGELNLYRYSKWSYCPYAKVITFLLYSGNELKLEYDEKLHPAY